MPIEVWSINKRRDVAKDPAVEERLLGWLKSLKDPTTAIPDVLCLQDFRVELATHLGRLPELAYAAMTDHLITSADGRLKNDRQLVGDAIASHFELLERFKPFTWGDGLIRPLMGVANNERLRPNSSGHDEIDQSEARRFIAAVVNAGDEKIPIGTTHGYWVDEGVFTPEQEQSTQRLIRHIGWYARKYGGVVVFADWNLNDQVLEMLLDSGAREHPLPEGTETTMAPDSGGAKYKAKPDRILQWPDRNGNYRFRVENIHLSDAPGSDHLMLCGTVSLAA